MATFSCLTSLDRGLRDKLIQKLKAKESFLARKVVSLTILNAGGWIGASALCGLLGRDCTKDVGGMHHRRVLDQLLQVKLRRRNERKVCRLERWLWKNVGEGKRGEFPRRRSYNEETGLKLFAGVWTGTVHLDPAAGFDFVQGI